MFEKDVYYEVELGSICDIARGASPRPIDQYITHDDNGINWIRIGDANKSRYITSTAEKITIDGAKKSRIVKAGDFILSNSMSFGRPYILKIDGCIHDGWLVLKFDKSKLNVIYFYEYLSLPSTYEKMKNLASGMVVENLNSYVIEKLPILLPPLDKQNEFASYVDSIDKLRFAAEQKKRELLEQKKALFDKYFR